MSRNIILYGPPGTGKTYMAKLLAVKLLENGIIPEQVKISDILNDKNVTREDVTKKFKEKINSSIKFVSFHQSFSYEDFVAGKTIGDGGKVEIKDGVLKEFLFTEKSKREEEFNVLKDEIIQGLNKSDPYIKTIVETQLDFQSLALFKPNDRLTDYNNSFNINKDPKESVVDFINRIKKALKNDEYNRAKFFKRLNQVSPFIGGTIELDVQSKLNNNDYDIFYTNGMNWRDSIRTNYNVQTVTTNYYFTKRVVGVTNPKVVYVCYIDTVSYQNQMARNPNSNNFDIDFDVLLKMHLEHNYTNPLHGDQPMVNILKTLPRDIEIAKVLIIDEINRGNISAIFGELITLLEENYREGMDEELNVTLSSGEPFTLPKNLYIIGTMNTADRSAEQMDAAMRRRFEFVELVSDPELVKDDLQLTGNQSINLKELLSTINARIEVLMGKDYCIGHAYFLKVKNEEDLKKKMFNEIIPLLEQYFYNDIEKIGMVLSDQFLADTKDISNIFNKTDGLDNADVPRKLKKAQDFIEAQDFINAMLDILQKPDNNGASN